MLPESKSQDIWSEQLSEIVSQSYRTGIKYVWNVRRFLNFSACRCSRLHLMRNRESCAHVIRKSWRQDTSFGPGVSLMCCLLFGSPVSGAAFGLRVLQFCELAQGERWENHMAEAWDLTFGCLQSPHLVCNKNYCAMLSSNTYLRSLQGSIPVPIPCWAPVPLQRG